MLPARSNASKGLLPCKTQSCSRYKCGSANDAHTSSIDLILRKTRLGTTVVKYVRYTRLTSCPICMHTFCPRQSYVLLTLRNGSPLGVSSSMSSSPPPPLPQGQQTFFSFRNSSWLIVALVATAVATFMREPTLRRGIRNIFETSSAATDCVDAHQYLTDVMPVKGFHVLCIKPTTSDTCVECSRH